MIMDNGKIYVRDYTGDDTIPAFLTFCVEQYKNYKGISGQEAFELISTNGILDYLEEHYEALHLESRQWLMKTIDELVESKVLIS